MAQAAALLSFLSGSRKGAVCIPGSLYFAFVQRALEERRERGEEKRERGEERGLRGKERRGKERRGENQGAAGLSFD